MPPRPQTDALRGSLDLLILKTLSLAPMHGWGISQRVQQISKGVLEVNQGSLYPALQRLEKNGLVASDWDTTDNNRRARYYRLTVTGRRALGVELRSGRMLRESDRNPEAEEGVVVINQALADEFFPGEDPLGRRIAFMDRWDRIVGVVGNVAEAGLRADPVPVRYMTHEQVPWLLPIETVVIRVDPGRDPAAILDAARRAIQATAPTVAIQDLTTMENIFDRAIGPARQVMSLLTLLGALALALGTIGVYGVVSHFVARRRRDWGIRIALGMRPARVMRRIIGQGGALVCAGLVFGITGFLILARLLASFLYDVGPWDPVTFVAVPLLLMAVAAGAAVVPARRASRVDPVRALRAE